MATETLPLYGAPTCHPDRRVYAKGLCNSCYRRSRMRLKKERATCHPERAHKAKGMCAHCYKAHLERSMPPARKSARWRRASLKRSFGLSELDVERMRAAQANRCGMCGQTFGTCKKTRPNVDHDHKTGRVRGLLCFPCNVGLGRYEKYRESAERYLARQ